METVKIENQTWHAGGAFVHPAAGDGPFGRVSSYAARTGVRVFFVIITNYSLGHLAIGIGLQLSEYVTTL